MIDGLINTRGKGVVPDDLLQTATEHLLEDVDNETFADQMADFFRRERS
jgi:GMP synthase (glutamine-hydrolysing)